MGNRYTEVLMTYVRRPFSSWRAAFWIAFILWTVFSDGGGSPGHIGTGSVTTGGLFLGFWLWLHFREQLVHPRRAITPHYVSTSIAVFVAMGLLAAAWPVFFMLVQNHGFRVGLFVALAVYIFGLVGWAIAANTLLVTILCGVAILGPLNYLGALESNSNAVYWLAATNLLGCGLAAGTWAIWKLSHFTEDQRGYGRIANGSYDLASLGRSVGRFFGHLLGPATSARHVDGQNGAAPITYGMPMALDGTLRDTLRRWCHTGVWAMSLLPALFVVCYAASIIEYGLARSPSEMVRDFNIIVPLAVMLPAFVLARWGSAWSCLALESLRPESRARFAGGIFLTIAVQILLAWLTFAATVWLTVVIVDHSLKDTATLALGLLATGMIQPLAYAVVCWLLPHGTRSAYFFVSTLMFMAVGMGTTLTFWGTRQAVGVAAVLMAAGLILIPFAYRRWLGMEMGRPMTHEHSTDVFI